jgi:hypothetical protein
MLRSDTAPQDTASSSMSVRLGIAGAGVASSARIVRDRTIDATREARRPASAALSAEAWVQVTLCVVVAALLLFVISLPRRTSAVDDASRLAAARALHVALQKLRGAVSDYRFDHGEWPGSSLAQRAGPMEHAAPGCADPASSGSASRGGATQPGEHLLLDGYLDERVPVNPIDGLSTVRILGDQEDWPSSADDSSGWVYRPRTGELRANCRGRVPGASLRYFDL